MITYGNKFKTLRDNNYNKEALINFASNNATIY